MKKAKWMKRKGRPKGPEKIRQTYSLTPEVADMVLAIQDHRGYGNRSQVIEIAVINLFNRIRARKRR